MNKSSNPSRLELNLFKASLISFIVSLSILTFEIIITRLFSAVYFSSFTFFIVSVALLGIGMSGLQFAISKVKRISIYSLLLLFSISIPLAIFLTIKIKIDFLNIFNPATNLINLVLNFFILIIPFFLGGGVLVRLFSQFSDNISKLYFFDLTGAGFGALLTLLLFPILGVVNFSIFLSISILIIVQVTDSNMKKKIFSALIVAFFIILSFSQNSLFRIIPKIEKRDYIKDLLKNRIEFSTWSSLNKIDIAPFVFSKNRKVIWLNCGTQQSWLVKTQKSEIGKKKIKWTQASIPYQLTEKDSAFIIGSAGGFEVLCSVSNGFKRVVAVEMDSELCKLVKGKYSGYIGDLFHRKGVYLINGEGRSMLNRIDKKFNVIQMVNSHPRDTLLSGGLSISETYIYTREAFKDYWNHLKQNGFLSIVHIYGERIFSTALEALRDMNVKNPQKKFFIIQDEKGFNFFFMKKGNILQKDINILAEFAGNKTISFSPDRKKKNIYYEMAYGDFKDTVKRSSVNISPVRDISPYLNQPNKIGQFTFTNNRISGIAKKKIYSVLKFTNYTYISIFLISLLFSLFFIYLPLRRKKVRADGKIITYFFLIGCGYICIEIVLIKIFQLAIGNPPHSMTFILFTLLISTGTGSLFSKRILKFFRNNIFYLSLFTSLLLIFFSFSIFPLIYVMFKINFAIRVTISFLLIILIGVPLGVFFPFGIMKLSKIDKNLIGWAWGSNGFATVLGSVAAVIISINFNFPFLLCISAIVYTVAGLILQYRD